jgi:hypothetical protein
MRMIALQGNLTTTDGKILDGDDKSLDNGVPIAKHLGLASCGRCGHNGQIFGTATTFPSGNTHGVQDGDIVMCRCPRRTNRVIARSTIFYQE